MPPLLSMHGISKRFGASHALRDVSLDVSPGEVLALIGENGAGKSTLMKVLSGAYRPDAGRMEINGQPYAPRHPHDARRAGVAMIYQELNLAPHLSVEDNIMLGQERSRFGWLDRTAQRRRVREVLSQLGHSELPPEAPVQGLSTGTRQIVEIARALVNEARVIVFDEPTSSLTRADVTVLFNIIHRLRSAGLGIVYISHFLEEIREICDRYTVLRDGSVSGHGCLEGTTEREIVALMIGRSVEELFPHVPHTPGAVLLSLEGLSGRKKPRGVSLELRRGEIFGIAGLVGAGRTELVRCLYGLDPVKRGTVRVAQLQPAATPPARMRAGLGMVSDDRKGEGLAQARSLTENLTYSRLSPYTSLGMINVTRENAAARLWRDKLNIKAHSVHQPVSELSGGNQQKVAIARVLHQEAEILLLDEPTRGIDVGTKADIYRLMGELAAAGKTVLFVSSYMTELLAVCDRIGVMSRGQLQAVRPTGEWTEETLLAAALATDTERN